MLALSHPEGGTQRLPEAPRRLSDFNMVSGGGGGVGGHQKILSFCFYSCFWCPEWNEPKADSTSQINMESSIPNDIIVNDIYINAYPGALINSRFHACE